MQITGSYDKSLNKCIGHYEYVVLELLVFYIDYFKTIIGIFRSICKVYKFMIF